MHPAPLARQTEQVAQHIGQAAVDVTQPPSTSLVVAPGRTLAVTPGPALLTELGRADGMTGGSRPAAAQPAASLSVFAATLAEQHLGMAGAGTDEVPGTARRRHHGQVRTEPDG